MKHIYQNALQGVIILTDEIYTSADLQAGNTLYKFIWFQEGIIKIVINHVERVLKAGEIIALNPMHNFEIKETKGKYIVLLFNSYFYGVYKHNEEVSCNGLLFTSPHTVHLHLPPAASTQLYEIIEKMKHEYMLNDNLEGEVLRLLLKHFIIICTRLAKEELGVTIRKENALEIARQYYILVDRLFVEKKKVQDYAEILHRSPKTLSNLFATYKLPSPQRIIQERIVTEAKRLLLSSTETAKEIAAILGYDSVFTFSRFFKRMTGESISDFRERNKTSFK
ncbi:helix-turn-helix domain-containing protein [Phocaeicola sp.]